VFDPVLFGLKKKEWYVLTTDVCILYIIELSMYSDVKISTTYQHYYWWQVKIVRFMSLYFGCFTTLLNTTLLLLDFQSTILNKFFRQELCYDDSCWMIFFILHFGSSIPVYVSWKQFCTARPDNFKSIFFNSIFHVRPFPCSLPILSQSRSSFKIWLWDSHNHNHKDWEKSM